MKIGIVGSGKIVETCLEALQQTTMVECAALCVRKKSLSKANILASSHGIEVIYTDYAEFLLNSEFELVYIGIINTMHFTYAHEALLAGKHVILEKPFTVTWEEAKKLADIAKAKKLFIWEAITTLYYPNFRVMEQHLQDIGDIKLIQANYSQYSSRYDAYMKGEVLPAFDPKLKGGALFDINIYNLHVVTKLFGMPNRYSYKANKGYNGVDTSGVALLEYSEFVAVCCGAKDSESPSGITIQGTKGYIQWHSPTNTSVELEINVNNSSRRFKEQKMANRMVFELEEMAAMYNEKDYARCYAYLEHSLSVMELLEKLGES
jgi:scyllo-inositol 2-dehydrogenase (NADP+)